jgi:hypothetical protein
VSTGPMKVTFLGNDEFRVYVETGQATSGFLYHVQNFGETFLKYSFWLFCLKFVTEQNSKSTYSYMAIIM